MRLFARPERPPEHLVSLLDADDRVLAFADTDAGTVVLASSRGLWWPEGESARLIGWQYVDKAIWRDGVLSVIAADVEDDLLLVDRAAISARLARPRDLPPTIRRRVEANVVHTEVLSLPGGAGRFVARRIPGRDGLAWWVRLEPGTRDAPQVRDAARRVIGELRAAVEVSAENR
jgi:hypothetical protein